ncbi:MAG: hypothetical protein QM537_07030 [Candidatus Symbiobacter sp.]|nr:hypothetical protein [Candidatus Symbiobacter sp.]
MTLLFLGVNLTHPGLAADPFAAPPPGSSTANGTANGTGKSLNNSLTQHDAAPPPQDAVTAAWTQPLFAVKRAIAEVEAKFSQAINLNLSNLKSDQNSSEFWHVWWVAMGVAFLYGVFHTIGPGHGKAVVISYFLSGDAKFWRGASIGIRIAGTHVFATLIVVLIIAGMIRTFIPISFEDMTAVKLVSYGAVILVGILLLYDALRVRFGRASAPHHHHDHAHDHHHHHDQVTAKPTERGNLISIVAGFVPCTGAIIILLFSIANNMLLLGSLLVAMIGVGMAVTMMVLGMVAVFARNLLIRWAKKSGGEPRHNTMKFALALVSPTIVIVVGISLFLSALGA